MDKNVFRNLSYGLYILTAREGDKDNGCVINTLQQAASGNTLSVSVNKQNLTHDMILRTGAFSVSILDTTAPFVLFQRFGFHSGPQAEQFYNLPAVRGANGPYYLPEHTNGYIGGRVFDTVDLGTHTLFLAEATEGERLGGGESLTYAYYHANVKPQPQPAKTKGWRCRICGYVYEGETLPADFICPLCKHGAEDFEPIA